jgi:hypothetical protein
MAPATATLRRAQVSSATPRVLGRTGRRHPVRELRRSGRAILRSLTGIARPPVRRRSAATARSSAQAPIPRAPCTECCRWRSKMPERPFENSLPLLIGPCPGLALDRLRRALRRAAGSYEPYHSRPHHGPYRGRSARCRIPVVTAQLNEREASRAAFASYQTQTTLTCGGCPTWIGTGRFRTVRR